jgi:hypothetical protein
MLIKNTSIIELICKLTPSSPCLWASFHPPIPSFSGICKVKPFLLNLSMKCWNTAFNAQGSRVIIVVVQVGAVKIYVAAVEALRKKEIQDETQFTTKIDGFLSFTPPCPPSWMLMYFFAGFFEELLAHPQHLLSLRQV